MFPAILTLYFFESKKFDLKVIIFNLPLILNTLIYSDLCDSSIFVLFDVD